MKWCQSTVTVLRLNSESLHSVERSLKSTLALHVSKIRGSTEGVLSSIARRISFSDLFEALRKPHPYLNIELAVLAVSSKHGIASRPARLHTRMLSVRLPHRSYGQPCSDCSMPLLHFHLSTFLAVVDELNRWRGKFSPSLNEMGSTLVWIKHHFDNLMAASSLA